LRTQCRKVHRAAVLAAIAPGAAIRSYFLWGLIDNLTGR